MKYIEGGGALHISKGPYSWANQDTSSLSFNDPFPLSPLGMKEKAK